MRAAPIQNSFNAGELSPQLKGRPDLEKYKNGCEILENFLPQISGPASRTPSATGRTRSPSPGPAAIAPQA